MPFKIFRSSAGSGKTFTLVKEYLRLSLASEKADAYRSILAITFTNKAAEEMKSRVLDVLSQMAATSAAPHAMAAALRNELGLDDEILSTRAQRTLKHMLHHYSDISISTIDHFTHQLIRSFAQDLELSVNFEVELDTDRLKQEIVLKLLTDIGSDSALTTALMNVLEAQMDDEKSWSILKQLLDFSQTLFTEESRFHLEKLKEFELEDFNRLRDIVDGRIKALSNPIIEQAKKTQQELKSAGIGASQLYYGSKGVFPFIERTAAGQFIAPNSFVKKAATENKWTGSKPSKNDLIALEPIIPDLLLTIEMMETHLPEIQYLSLIFNNLYGVALLDRLYVLQKQIQEEDDVLHIGEFNHLVSSVVMTETAPFIYERIGYRFSHFLVDEFQDTSVLQWFNLLPLIDESLAHDNLCLVVGDAKQSIYRWRGGDVRQFVELPRSYRTPYLDERISTDPEMDTVLQQRQQVIEQNSIEENLDKNYRSFANVVNFNNELFEWLQERMPHSMSKMYDDCKQKVTRTESGLVELRFFQSESNEKSWPEYDALTFQQIEKWISDSLADGFSPGDIAIIIRRNKDAVKIAKHLVSIGYNVVSNESLLINSSPKVRLLVNLAIYMTEPDDTVNITEAVQHLGLVRSETHLTSNRLISVMPEPVKGLKELLLQLYPNMDWAAYGREGIFGLFELLKHTLLDQTPDAYVNFFMDEVLAFSRKSNLGLIGFLVHWKDKRDKLSIALTESDDAIRISSIHKSKGLEFPVVIHPFVDYPLTARGDKIWAYLDDEQFSPLDRIRIPSGKVLETTPFFDLYKEESDMKQMDMFNELYVALTRAKARLYACGRIRNKNGKEADSPNAIQHVFNYIRSIDSQVADSLTHSRGERTIQEQRQLTSQRFSSDQVGNPNWKERILIARPSKEKWKTNHPDDARNLGILIHEALAHIRSAKDVEGAIGMLIEDGRIGMADAEELRMRVESLLNREELREVYNEANTIRNEADILLSNGSWVRPDRVVYNHDHAWIVDYKTGKATPKHEQQLIQYKSAMHELGFEQVTPMLVYLTENKVVVI